MRREWIVVLGVCVLVLSGCGAAACDPGSVVGGTRRRPVDVCSWSDRRGRKGG